MQGGKIMKKMSNETYDMLKWIAMIGLPALITFYGIVGATCHIPYTDAVLTIAGAFDAMMGTMLGISSSKYHKDNNTTE